jgi:hypothetical protein
MLGHVPGSIVTHRYAMGAHAEVDRAAAAALQTARDARRNAAVASAPTPQPAAPKPPRVIVARSFQPLAMNLCVCFGLTCPRSCLKNFNR